METKTVWNDFRIELLNYIQTRIHDHHAAEDILQDVFVKIHGNLGSLQNNQTIRPWLYSITRNTIIDYYRKKKDAVVSPEVITALSVTENDGDGTEEVEIHCLQSFINLLPETYKESIQLYEYKGLTHKEIASKLHITVSASKMRLLRGRQKLKDMMTACCEFEFDRLGKIIDIKRRKSDECCTYCDCNSPAD